jgi:hypothetical protein
MSAFWQLFVRQSCTVEFAESLEYHFGARSRKSVHSRHKEGKFSLKHDPLGRQDCTRHARNELISMREEHNSEEPSPAACRRRRVQLGPRMPQGHECFRVESAVAPSAYGAGFHYSYEYCKTKSPARGAAKSN